MIQKTVQIAPPPWKILIAHTNTLNFFTCLHKYFHECINTTVIPGIASVFNPRDRTAHIVNINILLIKARVGSGRDIRNALPKIHFLFWKCSPVSPQYTRNSSVFIAKPNPEAWVRANASSILFHPKDGI